MVLTLFGISVLVFVMLRLVPGTYREASLALGVPRWRTVLQVVMPTAAAGLITGAMLAVARIAGETAPLIFTTLGNNFWNVDPTRPMAARTPRPTRSVISTSPHDTFSNNSARCSGSSRVVRSIWWGTRRAAS